ncbi:MAG: 30S ribosomal protein S15 [Gammaproteobacteria bacterium AqS3]|nr:30S ribosomal protein S15 [Gammaproteobacteria bacterium AqS3]
MALDRQTKAAIVRQYGQSEKDTGRTEVQIALLTEDINTLQGHFKAYSKDRFSRRGLLHKVNRRRRLLNYLNKRDPERYRAIIKSLGLRR